jgi:hypothetical protein
MEKLTERFNFIMGLQPVTAQYGRVSAEEAKKIAIEFAEYCAIYDKVYKDNEYGYEELFNKFMGDYK